MLELNLRTYAQPFKGVEEWRLVEFREQVPADQTGILICDMWDLHWCRSATRRCAEIAERMQPVLDAARNRGVTVIHAPSDTMDFYEGAPQRVRAQSTPAVEPPQPREIAEPPLPIDDADGGCDDEPQCEQRQAWSRQTPALAIAEEDYLTDDGHEVYNILQARGIERLIIMGVHTNMCVLGRSFAIRQMARWGRCMILARDLTDTMYNPRMRPSVSHEEGTALVIEHIEKHWCPSIHSSDLLK